MPSAAKTRTVHDALAIGHGEMMIWFGRAMRSSLALLVTLHGAGVACARSATLSAAASRATAAAAAAAAAAVVAGDSLARLLHDSLQIVLDRAYTDSAFPGAIAVVGNHARILAQATVGRLDWGPSPVPDEHTLWDMASLTKVLGMTSAVMQLYEQGKIDLDAPLQRYIPEWRGPNKDRVTLRHLITHTSGLPAFKAYDRQTHDPDSLAKLMFSTPLDTMPGIRMVYSDMAPTCSVASWSGSPASRWISTS